MIAKIEKLIIKEFGLNFADLARRDKRGYISDVRNISIYLLRKYTRLTFREIGEIFDGRTTATIQMANNSIDGYMHIPELRDIILDIEKKLNK